MGARATTATACVAVAVLAAPSAHAETLRFTYVGGDPFGSDLVGLTGSAAAPVTGPTAVDGRITFRPSGSSVVLVLEDATLPPGATVAVRVRQVVAGRSSTTRACVAVRRPHRIRLLPGRPEVELAINGAVEETAWRCDAPATAGTGAVTWG